MAQRTSAKLLAATVTPLLFVADGLALLPVLLEVLSLEDEDDVEDDVEVEEVEEDDFDDVACSLALLKVEFVVELVPDIVMFILPVPIVEFVGPVVVELPEVPAAAVELLPDLDPEETIGAATPLSELGEAVEEGEEAVAEPGKDLEAEDEAKAAAALVGQVEHPPNSCSMPL